MNWTRQLAEKGPGSFYAPCGRRGQTVMTDEKSIVELPTNKSERVQEDAQVADGMGTACTRADERMAVAMGLVQSACTRFERCLDVAMGGLLAGLPALCANGLLSGLSRHFRLPPGYYTAMHILTLFYAKPYSGEIRKSELWLKSPYGVPTNNPVCSEIRS